MKEKIFSVNEEVQLEAVKQNGYAIKYIENPTEEVQLAAVKQNGNAIRFIENPYESVIKEVCKTNHLFNKLINEVLLNKETWKIFKLDNVKVDYVLDDNGKLIKEILTLNLNIDYDLMLTSLDSNLTLKFEINF